MLRSQITYIFSYSAGFSPLVSQMLRELVRLVGLATYKVVLASTGQFSSPAFTFRHKRIYWCRERDLNPYGCLDRGILSPLCLPIPPPRHI